MKILCHRGYWKTAAEKNTQTAFLRGFELGLGTETDIRDLDGTLVVSHDPARGGTMLFSDFLRHVPREVLLALNVKADGLTEMAARELRQAGHEQYVFFDMSVPDMLPYLRAGEPVALRLSEYEAWNDALATKATHIWLDAFNGTWYSADTLRHLLETEKTVLVVSDELHGRDKDKQWKMLESFADSGQLILCTDYPEDAMARFCR